MKEGKIVYFIQNEELCIGKITKKLANETFQILTYTNKETHVELVKSNIYSSFKDADDQFQKLYPKAELDVEKLMDIARFLQS